MGGVILAIIIIIIISNVNKTAKKDMSYKGNNQNMFNRSLEDSRNEIKNSVNTAKGNYQTSGNSYPAVRQYNRARGSNASGYNYGKSPMSVAERNDLNRRFNTPNTSYDNHIQSSSLMSGELSDANRIWLEEQRKMAELNNKFNQDIMRQHQENLHMMQEASKLNR